jgi:hypothetical protein
MTDPRPGPLAMTDVVVLPNGLHRIAFRQSGQEPDIEALKAHYGPKDGQYVYAVSWLQYPENVGYACLAWKEWQCDPLPGMK